MFFIPVFFSVKQYGSPIAGTMLPVLKKAEYYVVLPPFGKLNRACTTFLLNLYRTGCRFYHLF